MNRKVKIRLIFSLCILVAVFISTTTSSVLASRSTYSSSVGGTGVVAQKDVVRSGGSWNGYIWSHTNTGYAIGTIGWTWWTIRETCSGTIISQYQYGGQVLYNASAINDVAVDTVSFCANPSNQHGRVLGTHDFKNGSDTWNPYWEHVEKLY
jgi:hypothetical protein